MTTIVSRVTMLAVTLVLVLTAVRLAIPHRNVASSPEGATFAAGVAEMDALVLAARARLASHPTSWMDAERAAGAHLNRGRYCGRWSDYAAADSLMARAFEIAPAGAGPFLGRARLNFTMHRFDRVEGDLVRAESQLLLSPRVRSEIDLLRADVAVQQGNTEAALAQYRRAVEVDPNFDNLARLAGGLATTDLAAADAMFVKAANALPRSATRERAWVSLQRGLLALEANRLDEALARYREAKAQFPGWWLADEHIAEALALQGHDAEALEIYQSVLKQTGNPEFMDQVARIYRSRGDEASAGTWILLAKRGHAARMARFPEAAAGHAQRHIQDFGEIALR